MVNNYCLLTRQNTKVYSIMGKLTPPHESEIKSADGAVISVRLVATVFKLLNHHSNRNFGFCNS